MKLVSPPKTFRISKTRDFLRKISFVFNIRKFPESGVLFQFNKVRELSILNLLITYKIMNYGFKNKLFIKPQMSYNNYLDGLFKKFGFFNMFHSMSGDESLDTDDKTLKNTYKEIQIREEGDLLIAAQPLFRNVKNIRVEINMRYMKAIYKYYADMDNVKPVVFQSLSEIILNFWEHATEDEESVIVGYGNKDKFEIACADNGQGIITSLCELYHDVPRSKLLEHSTNYKITSKPKSNHMGCGLWLINEIAKETKGKLYIYSEGYYFENNNGIIKTGTCGYWKGTIVYLYLNLNSTFSLLEIEALKNEISKTKVELNFI